MPKRTNTFQQVVAIVQSHMADGATIEESAMVTPIRGGDQREVDVLVTGVVGGHKLRVGIEASKRKRRADVGWVEQMKAKHEDLPTDRLVLSSASGFTKGALSKAMEHGIATVGAEELPEKGLEQRVLDGLRSIWPKLVTLTPERAKVWVRYPDSEVHWFKAPGDLALFYGDGTELGPGLQELATRLIQSQWPQIIEQIGLRDIAESMERPFVVVWKPFSVIVDGTNRDVYARKEDIDPPELHPVEQVEVTGRAIIEVQEVSLTHMRLGEARVAYGEMTLKDRPGVVVASDGSGEEMLTVRVSGGFDSTRPLPQSESTLDPEL